MAAIYASSINTQAILKELYKDPDEFMQDLVYKENPTLALLPKDESIDGLGGKYIPVPLEYGVPQGRSHTFANAQGNQTPAQLVSYFVYVISDYQLVTITNLLMEQTKTDAAAFAKAAKLELDGGFRNETNNIAFEIFGDGSGTRALIGAGATNPVALTYVIPLDNMQKIVQFEVGMTLVNFSVIANVVAILSTSVLTITRVQRDSGIITGTTAAPDASWLTAGSHMAVQGDVQAGALNTGTALALSGFAAWIPASDPLSTDPAFWGVDRSVDPTRLAGLRYDASAFTIEEGITNALAFAAREGAKPDLIIMDFASYAALTNSVSAKVQYVQVRHDEAEIAFDGLSFQYAYGKITILADRSCPPQTAYILTMDTWKLRSLGKVPHILTYGMEGLEGLRVGNADALEIRIGYYGNLTCRAPGRNMVVALSS